jgi:hypothetical protein
MYTDMKTTTKISFESACNRYVHRFTMEHVPAWAKEVREDGTYYAPHYRSDREWYDNTEFPPVFDGCYSTGQTWPLGKELTALFVLGQGCITETTHTPGPWTTHKMGNTIYYYQIENNKGKWIADVKNQDQHSEANARLITAAPELLEVCKSILELLSAHPGETDYVDSEIISIEINGKQIKELFKATQKAEGHENKD